MNAATPESLLSAAVARCDPQKPLIYFRDQRIDYGTVQGTLARLAKSTRMEGRRILLLLPDGPAAFLAHVYFFGQGALTVPLSVQTSTPRIESLCKRLQPHYVVTSRLLRIRHATALAGAACIELNGESLQDFASAIESCGAPATVPANAAGAEEVRVIFFTSGSTGEPKGVCLGADNILAAANMNVSVLGLDNSRRSLVTVPLYDYYGFIQIYSHLLAGGSLVLGESLAFPGQMLRRINAVNATDMVLVPHTLRELLRVTKRTEAEAALAALRYMTSSSDLLNPELLADIFRINPQLKLFNVYGLTEAGRACFRCIEASTPASNSIGRPAPGVEIVIDGPVGEPGEIIIRGPNVMRGYFRGLDAARLYQPCKEMATGDIGYYDASGELVLLGRKDHQFNLKGAKIHPAEIERLALHIDGVGDAVARLEVENEEKVIHLDVVPSRADLDLRRLEMHLRQNLPANFVPKHIHRVLSIRRTEIGSKIVRQKMSA